MPEQRPETPTKYRCLESFLWHDYKDGRGDWTKWLRRKLPDVSSTTGEEAFHRAMQLHAALRSLQAENSRMHNSKDLSTAREALNRLITAYQVHPRIGEDLQILLVVEKPEDPVAALLLAALGAIQSSFWRRFKLCNEPTCRASFYDASKAAVKTWCSMQTCGSRNKMFRYRAKS